MIPVVPYIKTLGTERFKEFLNSPFDLDFLLNYFDGWKGKVMGDWWKFTNDKITLEFFPVYYDVKKWREDIRLPLPKTLNDFINDMDRLGIELFWSAWVEENLEPKDFLQQDKIKEYYQNLLNELDKGHEILNTSEDGI